MSKRIISVIIAIIVFAALSVTAFSAGTYVKDEANVLTDGAEYKLEDELSKLSGETGCDIVCAVFSDMADYGYSDIQAFADDFYDEGGYSQDGIALVISLADRDYYITTTGKCIYYFNDYGDTIDSSFISYLSSGNYYSAFSSFGEKAASIINYETTDGKYSDFDFDTTDYYNDFNSDAEYEPQRRNPVTVVRSAIISILSGLFGGAIGTKPMKNKLKSVARKSDARGYIQTESLNLIDQSELFLYKKTDTMPKASASNNTRSAGGGGGSHFGGGGVHMSSGGSFHGGHGGKF